MPCMRCSRLCSAGWLRLSCPCVALDYVPQDGFGFRALHALLSTMFRRMASAFVPCVRCSRLCSAGWLRLSCPTCVALDVPQGLRALRALLSTMFRRRLRLSCPACVALDYVPQDGFGFRALRAFRFGRARRSPKPSIRTAS